MVEKVSLNITEDEAALYDRQIRLWGLDAQKRLRAAKVLLIGLGGLGAEVAKNIVLAGIQSLKLLDHNKVSEEDTCSQFLISRDVIGKNRAECSLKKTQELNPMVSVSADTDNVANKDLDYFTRYDVICATCCDLEQLVRINDVCHKNNILFFAGDVFGFYGFSFADLNEHEYADEIPQKKKTKSEESGDAGEPAAKKAKLEEPDTVTVKKVTSYVRLKNAINVDWSTETMARKIKRTPKTYFIIRVLMEFISQQQRRPASKTREEDKDTLAQLKDKVLDDLQVDKECLSEDFASHCFAELSPVCAVTGGVIGQEIIKAVSQKDAPHNNFFFYNGVEGSGMVDRIG